MDAATASVWIAGISAAASMVAAGLAAWAAIRSGSNGSTLREFVPIVIRLERQTNSILADRDRASSAAGETVGRAAATAEGEARAAGLAAGQASQTAQPTQERTT